MSYQPDERYWTDYLRVALPVVGLLLLLGAFWYWAAALIGDGDDQAPTAATGAMVEGSDRVEAATPTATMAPTPTGITPTPGPPPPSPTVPAAGPNGPTPTPTGPVVPPPDEGNGTIYEVGQIVVTLDDDVNMRDRPSIDGQVVETLSRGTPLEITGRYEEAGALDWWPVRNAGTGRAGFIREELLGPQP